MKTESIDRPHLQSLRMVAFHADGVVEAFKEGFSQDEIRRLVSELEVALSLYVRVRDGLEMEGA